MKEHFYKKDLTRNFEMNKCEEMRELADGFSDKEFKEIVEDLYSKIEREALKGKYSILFDFPLNELRATDLVVGTLKKDGFTISEDDQNKTFVISW